MSQKKDWAAIAERVRQAGGAWLLVAEDVSTGTARAIAKRHGLDTRVEGVDRKTHRVARLFARFAPVEPLSLDERIVAALVVHLALRSTDGPKIARALEEVGVEIEGGE